MAWINRQPRTRVIIVSHNSKLTSKTHPAPDSGDKACNFPQSVYCIDRAVIILRNGPETVPSHYFTERNRLNTCTLC